MWPINYDDINKFHMSIGIGLLVASFLLLLFVIGNNENAIDNQIELLLEYGNSTQEYTSLRTNYIIQNTQNYERIIRALFIMGGIIFSIGYIPFLIKEGKYMFKFKKQH